MAARDTAGAVGQRDPDVLHHALILMVEDVTMPDEIAM